MRTIYIRRYIAIGHWDTDSNITCTISWARSAKEFREECRANGFIVWAALSEGRIAQYYAADPLTRRDMAPACYHAEDVRDCLEQCGDIIEQRFIEHFGREHFSHA